MAKGQSSAAILTSSPSPSPSSLSSARAAIPHPPHLMSPQRTVAQSPLSAVLHSPPGRAHHSPGGYRAALIGTRPGLVSPTSPAPMGPRGLSGEFRSRPAPALPMSPAPPQLSPASGEHRSYRAPGLPMSPAPPRPSPVNGGGITRPSRPDGRGEVAAQAVARTLHFLPAATEGFLEPVGANSPGAVVELPGRATVANSALAILARAGASPKAGASRGGNRVGDAASSPGPQLPLADPAGRSSGVLPKPVAGRSPENSALPSGSGRVALPATGFTTPNEPSRSGAGAAAVCGPSVAVAVPDSSPGLSGSQERRPVVVSDRMKEEFMCPVTQVLFSGHMSLGLE